MASSNYNRQLCHVHSRRKQLQTMPTIQHTIPCISKLPPIPVPIIQIEHNAIDFTWICAVGFTPTSTRFSSLDEFWAFAALPSTDKQVEDMIQYMSTQHQASDIMAEVYTKIVCLIRLMKACVFAGIDYRGVMIALGWLTKQVKNINFLN